MGFSFCDLVFSRLYYKDLECDLKLVYKLTNDHINLTSESVVMVSLAAQGLRETVGNVPNSFGSEETVHTVQFCFRIQKTKAFLDQYCLADDAKFEWLDELLEENQPFKKQLPQPVQNAYK